MSYNSAIKKVMSLTDFERSVKDPNNRVFKLDRMFFLLEELGNPQAKIPAIHIAGTKGKGSTASMIESILSHSGYVTGLFTSPHLHKFTERIRIMNQPISDTEFEALVDKVWSKLFTWIYYNIRNVNSNGIFTFQRNTSRLSNC